MYGSDRLSRFAESHMSTLYTYHILKVFNCSLISHNNHHCVRVKFDTRTLYEGHDGGSHILYMRGMRGDFTCVYMRGMRGDLTCLYMRGMMGISHAFA